MSGIDPLRLAQFMVLPGAAELVDAFSAIPPGPIRDSVVHHARVLAEASGWTPPGFAMHTPMEPARIAGPPRLSSPFTDGLVSTSAEGQIVERAMRGEADHLIAADLGVKLGVVVRLKRKARKEGGVVFPGDEGAPPEPKPSKGKGSPLKGRSLPGIPIPPPPWWWEDPESPVWDNRHLLPGLSANPTGSLAAIGPHDGRSFTAMEGAASRRGMTLRDYIGRRLEMVARVEAGEEPVDVALSYPRTPPQELYSLLTKIGRNHMRTLLARQKAAVQAPTPAPEPEVTPPPPKATNTGSAEWARQAAADKWGFPTVHAYEAMRAKVRDLRMEGWHRSQIVKELGMAPAFVKATIQYWSRERGVRFPAAPFKLKTTVKAA